MRSFGSAHLFHGLLFLCMCLCAVLLSVSCLPECAQDLDCSPKDTLPCFVRTDAVCRREDGDLSRRPGKLEWGGGPRDVMVSAVRVPCGEGTVAGIRLQWRPPVHGNLEHIKAFKILLDAHVGKLRGGPGMCRLLDLRNATWTLDDVDVAFQYTVFPLPGGTTFSVQLYSLPLPEVQHQRNLINVTLLSTPPAGASVWETRVVWSVDSGNNINVSFHMAPSEYNFNGYDVILMDLHTYESQFVTIEVKPNATSSTSLQTVYTTFQNVSTGHYQLEVFPYGGACNSDCKTSRSPAFTVQPVNPGIETAPQLLTELKSSEQAQTSGKSDDVIKSAVGCSVAAVVVVGVVFGSLYCLRRRKWKCAFMFGRSKEALSHTTSDIPGTTRLLPLERKRAFLVYSTDSEAFLALVGTFASYLHTYCFLEVLHVDWCFQQIRSKGLNSWVHNSLQTSDVIIVVHSTGSVKQTRALMEGKWFTSVQSSVIGCLFVDALSLIMTSKKIASKCIDVTFKHSDDSDILNFCGDKHIFRLMNDFEGFLIEVHKLNNTAHLYDLPYSANHRKTDEGRQLLQAILQSNKHDETNPHWYETTLSNLDVIQGGSNSSCDDIISHKSSGYYSQEQYEFVEPEVISEDENSESLLEHLMDINSLDPAD